MAGGQSPERTSKHSYPSLGNLVVLYARSTSHMAQVLAMDLIHSECLSPSRSKRDSIVRSAFGTSTSLLRAVDHTYRRLRLGGAGLATFDACSFSPASTRCGLHAKTLSVRKRKCNHSRMFNSPRAAGVARGTYSCRRLQVICSRTRSQHLLSVSTMLWRRSTRNGYASSMRTRM